MRSKIFTVLNYIALLVFAVGACSLDSDNMTIPAIMALGGAGWLFLSYLANAEYLEDQI